MIYVNGQEVIRDNMPDGEVGFETQTTRAIPRRDENVFFDFDGRCECVSNSEAIRSPLKFIKAAYESAET